MSQERPVGSLSLLALGINGIVGVGIFFLPTTLVLHAGPADSVLLLGAVAVGLAPVALTFSILGRRFDQDGGPVTFARAAFGDRVAFVVGWLAYVSALFSTAAVLSGLSQAVLGARAATWAAPLLAVALGATTSLGIAPSRHLWSWLTVLKLLPLVALAAFVFVAPAAAAPSGLEAPTAGRDLLRGALAACFAYQGFEVVPVVAGQTREVDRAVPRAVFGSLAFAAVLYTLLQLLVVRVGVPVTADAPLVAAAARASGSALSRAVALGTSVSALGIALGMMVTTPRYLAAAARGRLHITSLTGVPKGALLVTTLLLLPLVASARLTELVELSSLAVVAQYASVAAALLALSLQRQKGLRRRHAVPALLTLALAALLLAAPSRREWAVFGAVTASGLVALWLRAALAERNKRSG